MKTYLSSLCMLAILWSASAASATEPSPAPGKDVGHALSGPVEYPALDDENPIVAQDQVDPNPDKLPTRIAERTAGRLAGPAGAALGGIVGYSVMGVPGLVIGTAAGTAIFEVFAEFIISRMLRPEANPLWRPFVPMLPRP
jgi:hypothetical protein